MQWFFTLCVEGIEPATETGGEFASQAAAGPAGGARFNACVRAAVLSHEVDDGLADLAEVQRLGVAKRRDGGEGALPRLVRLPGSQQPVEGRDCWV